MRILTKDTHIKFHTVTWTLGVNRHHDLLSRIITIGTWSTLPFRATNGNGKRAVFLFNLSSHDHVYIVKQYYVFTQRDADSFENLEEITVLACETCTSCFCPWLKKVAFSSSLLLILTKCSHCHESHIFSVNLWFVVWVDTYFRLAPEWIQTIFTTT